MLFKNGKNGKPKNTYTHLSLSLYIYIYQDLVFTDGRPAAADLKRIMHETEYAQNGFMHKIDYV